MKHIEHLSKDRRLRKLIETGAARELKRRTNICTYLCNSIMSQQLSTKVADVFHRRFLALYGGRDPSPKEILDTPFETLRGIGLSNAKANYLRNVAEFEIEFGMDHRKLHEMSNEEVIGYLTVIKGVGKWTVEMLLMFALAREDVFSVDDLGIQNAMVSLYKLDKSNKKKLRESMELISQKWSPYRTYACIYLWGWKDNAPVVKGIAKKPVAKKKVVVKKKKAK